MQNRGINKGPKGNSKIEAIAAMGATNSNGQFSNSAFILPFFEKKKKKRKKKKQNKKSLFMYNFELNKEYKRYL